MQSVDYQLTGKSTIDCVFPKKEENMKLGKISAANAGFPLAGPPPVPPSSGPHPPEGDSRMSGGGRQWGMAIGKGQRANVSPAGGGGAKRQGWTLAKAQRKRKELSPAGGVGAKRRGWTA